MNDTNESQNKKLLDEGVEAAITFRIAENAKTQVWNWGKWILSVGALCLAILGFRGYTDFSDTIKGLDKNISEKVDVALQNKFTEVEAAIKKFEDKTSSQYAETVIHLERTRQQSEDDLHKLEKSNAAAIEQVTKLVDETKKQFTTELQEVQKRKQETIVALDLSYKTLISRPHANGPASVSPFQWHLQVAIIDGTTIDQHANVVAAWDLAMGQGITIAVIDDGFDITHEEFQGLDKIVFPHDVTKKNDNPTPDTFSPQGTSTAGVAAANGQHGAAGVAPRARIMPIRLASGLGSQAEADAFVWAANHGADVISVSWGPEDGLWSNPSDPLHDKVTPLPASTRVAIDDAIARGRNGKGTVIVWSAGNGNESVDNDGYASYDKVITVAASNDRGTRTVYSDHGKAIWCAFPSNDFGYGPFGHPEPLTSGIWTTDVSGSGGFNRGKTADGDAAGNYINSFGGTSSAAPGVAGVAALILSVNPELRWDQVKDILKLSSDKIDKKDGQYDENGHSPFYGYGRVNARRAVELARTYRRAVP